MTEQFDEWEARIRLAGEEAKRRLRVAAEQGDTDAAFKLARCISYDYENGIKWLHLAAEQGHKHAQLRLGNVLAGRFKSYGDHPSNPRPPADHTEAIKWYRMAAENGLARARRCIVDLETPTPPDKLHKMLRVPSEAQKGDQHVQFRHALMYFHIKPQDNVRAYLWLSLSAAQGNQRAKETRDVIEQRMTPAQTAEAQKLAREWKSDLDKMVDEIFNEVSKEELDKITKETKEKEQEALRKGTCVACGDLIPKARLQAVPGTTFCVECAVRRIIADEGLDGLAELFGGSGEIGAAKNSAQSLKKGKTLLNVDEIELMLMIEFRRVRFDRVMKITVTRDNDSESSNWKVDNVTHVWGVPLRHSTWPTIDKIEERLKKRYDVAWRD